MATSMERKMAQLQREKDAGYKQISFHIPPDAAAHLKALVGAYGKTQSQVLVRALAEAYERQAEEDLIAGLDVTDNIPPKQAAAHLLEICAGDREKARTAFLGYLQRKHPGYTVNSKDEAHKKIENRYKAVSYQLGLQAGAWGNPSVE